jgi:hypothetical protein
VSDLDNFCLSCGARIGAGAAASAGVPIGLRPLGVGERIDAAIKAFRSNYASMLRALVAVIAIGAVLQALVTISIPTDTIVIQHVANDGSVNYTFNWTALWSTLAAVLVSVLLVILLSEWASAVCIQIIGGSVVGSPVGWRDARGRALRRLGSILWILTVATALVLAPLAALLVLFALFIFIGVKTLAVVVLVIGIIGYLVFAFWFNIGRSLAVASLMLEDSRGYAAIKRSFQLVRSSWWSVFATLLLAGLITGVAQFVLGLVFAATSNALRNNTPGLFGVETVRYLLTLAIITPFTATVVAILALDMRVRKEGLDIELLAREITATSPGATGPARSMGPSAFPALESPDAGPPAGDVDPAPPDAPGTTPPGDEPGGAGP